MLFALAFGFSTNLGLDNSRYHAQPHQQLLNKTWPVLLDAKPCQQIIGYSLLNEHGDLPFSIIGEPACSGNQTKPHNL